MHKQSMNPLLHGLFEVVKQFVMDEGGDGDACIVYPQYKELAALFEEHEKAHGNWFNRRIESSNSITFAHDNEFVCFIPGQPVLLVGHGQPGLIVEIPPWRVTA